MPKPPTPADAVTASFLRRNLWILTGQSSLAQTAWLIASPSIALTFLAVSLGMPVFLVAALITIRQIASVLSDVYLSQFVSSVRNRVSFLSLSDLILAICFGSTIVGVLLGTKIQAMTVFVVAVFVMGATDEFQRLLLMDFIGDNLSSQSRMTLTYAKIALGGSVATIFTWIAHESTFTLPAVHRHSVVIAIGVACFALSATATLVIKDFSHRHSSIAPEMPSLVESVLRNISGVVNLLKYKWLQRYFILKIMFVSAILSVPFFSLISAESHHTSSRGLTALLLSYATGHVIAGPLWGVLNKISYRLVMIVSTLLVALSGLLLIITHIYQLNHDVKIHVAALFVATIAVRGIITVISLYLIDVAPKIHRVEAAATSRMFGRIALIVQSGVLAFIAHMNETVWALALITIGSFLAAITSFLLIQPPADQHTKVQNSEMTPLLPLP